MPSAHEAAIVVVLFVAVPALLCLLVVGRGTRPMNAHEVEAHIWPVIYPAVREDVDLGQLRVNILDALEAALRPARIDGSGATDA